MTFAKRLGAMDTIKFYENQNEFLKKLKEKHGLLDAAIVFAPADIVTDSAIKSGKKRRVNCNCHHWRKTCVYCI